MGHKNHLKLGNFYLAFMAEEDHKGQHLEVKIKIKCISTKEFIREGSLNIH